MLKIGEIIAINGGLYEYAGIEDAEYAKGIQFHKVYEIDVDEDGIVTFVGNTWYFNESELANNTIEFTKPQWHGIVELFIRQGYENLTEEEINDTVENIVDKLSVYGMPTTIEELKKYITEEIKMLTVEEMNKINQTINECDAGIKKMLGYPLTDKEKEMMREHLTERVKKFKEYAAEYPHPPLEQSYAQRHYNEEIESKEMKIAILQLECDKFEEMEKVLLDNGYSKDKIENWNAFVIQRYERTEPYLEFNGGDLNRAYQDMMYDF